MYEQKGSGKKKMEKKRRKKVTEDRESETDDRFFGGQEASGKGKGKKIRWYLHFQSYEPGIHAVVFRRHFRLR